MQMKKPKQAPSPSQFVIHQSPATTPQRDYLHLQAIVEAQQDIAEAGLDIETVMQIIAERTQNLTSADGSVIELAEGEDMVYCGVSGSATNSRGLHLKQATSLSGMCVRTGKILRCDDSETDPRVDREACRRVGARSMIVVPLKKNQCVVGVLKVLSPRANIFNDEDVHTLQLMSGLAGNVLALAEEYEAKQQLLNERTAALEALQESEDRFRSSFAAAVIGKALVGLDGRWLQVNKALCELFGYEEAELLGLTFQQLTHPQDLNIDLAFLQQMLEGKRNIYRMEKRYIHKDGSVVWALLCVSIVRHSNGEPLYFVSEILDITEQKRTMQMLQEANVKLETLAQFDSLTGIHNRRGFDEHLADEIALAERTGNTFSLLFFDLDHFKQHNDTYGHGSGDNVLRSIGQILRSELHARDFLSRYGGEEFAVILPGTPGSAARRVAERVRHAIEVYPWPTANITASFGVVSWNGEDAQQFLSKADIALYAAKATGRNRVSHYEELNDESKDVLAAP